jgi:hypothetical protein
MIERVHRPDFLIIGAQKCGTTWLWEIIKQHPGTDLGKEKEIQFFSATNNYRRGREWYYAHFKKLDAKKMIGEASTDYLYDRILIDNITSDTLLPCIPELVKNELPDVKILYILRDPVRRAISAYRHHLQYRRFSPKTGLVEAAKKHPRLRIIERGYYAHYLELWQKHFHPNQMHSLVFEEDVVRHPEKSIQDVYTFLGLDREFAPKDIQKKQNKSWGWTHITLNYYLGPWYGVLYRVTRKTSMFPAIEKINFIKQPNIDQSDIAYLRSLYLPEKEKVEALLGRKLQYWDYS